MLKIFGSILVIFATTVFGFVYSEKFRQRSYQLKEIQRIIYEIQNNIVYAHMPLPEAMFNASYKANFPLDNFFETIGKLLSFNEVPSVYKAFVQAIKDNEDFLEITKDDENILLNLGKNLGESDIEGHKKVFTLTLDNLKQQIKDSEISIKKNVKMYRCLGFSLGSIIVIMLI